MNQWEIKGHVLEYIDESHQYLVDGVCVPSVTQILKAKFKKKYADIDKEVLARAASSGTAVHEAIEIYCKEGIDLGLKEVKNFQFLQKHYKFDVLDNEVPIILFKDDIPIAAGRLDLVLKIDDKIGGGDIKRTSSLDKEYLAYQLNLYRIGYFQSYGVEWEFLKGLHLREDTRRFVDIPINEEMAWGLVDLYLKDKETDNND